MNQQNSFTTTAAYFDQAELDVALDQNCYRTIAAGILVIGLLGSLNTPTLDVRRFGAILANVRSSPRSS